MSITYPLSLPSFKSPTRVVFKAMAAVSITRSPFSFGTSVQNFNGQLWRASVTLPPMDRADSAAWKAFLLKLNGQYGTFYLGDKTAASPRGTAAGTPRVNGGGQTGQSLATKGWTAGSAILKAADYIQIGDRLYMILNDISADGSGNATLDIWPRLRESPADNAVIVTANCVGMFRLAGNEFDIYDVAADFVSNLSFEAVEAT